MMECVEEAVGLLAEPGVASPSAGSSLPAVSAISSPIIRVCRKRSADPRTALIVQYKKHKADPLFFSLFKTSDSSDIVKEQQPTANVIDFTAPSEIIVQNVNEVDNAVVSLQEDPLAFANDSIGAIGGPEPVVNMEEEDVITVNGRPLVRAALPPPDEFVFDFYKIAAGSENIAANILQQSADQSDLEFDMRFATKEEELYLENDDSESDAFHEEDDDSNDEDNWRNEYPEDEEHDSESDKDAEDYDDDYGADDSDDDGLRDQMRRVGLEEYDEDDEEDD